jgi:hypothetical protein
MTGLWEKMSDKVFNQYGLIGLIAVAGIWFAGVVVRGEIKDLQVEMRAHAAVTSAASASLAVFSIEQKELSRDMLAIMRQTCLNTARTDAQRNRCVE